MSNHKIGLTVLSSLFALFALVYLPGLSGPFVFDDFPNIVNNNFVQINSLGGRELYHAAYSLQAGPLMRPIAMLSFALNYYFAGGFHDPTPYKLTNLVIHILNGLLVFWMTRIVFTRLPRLQAPVVSSAKNRYDSSILTAAAVALLWLVHPIQLTSVLYVVQRMTELSALFTLLGLIFYLKGRIRTTVGQPGGIWMMALGVLGCGTLGMLSKENAVLLPVFILIFEGLLFNNERPWPSWSSLSVKTKAALAAGAVVVGALALYGSIRYALPSYDYRQFTMPERVITEARVLLFYLSLILLPRINRFGLQHDDIVISESLLAPWTTLPAVLGIITIFVFAILARKRFPLIALGILWFFAGHLLESTILGLEIAHEHRNYLASLGPIMIIVCLIDLGCQKFQDRRLWALFPVLVVIAAATTSLRADQWADSNKLYRYEALHHPNSPRALAGLGALLAYQGQHELATQPMRRASELDPRESGYLMMAHLVAARAHKPLTTDDHNEILRRLAASSPTAYTNMVLQRIGNCIQATCGALQPHMEGWLTAIIMASRTTDDHSYYYNLLGRTLVGQGKTTEAIKQFRLSNESDPIYLHPLFELARLYLRLGQFDDASDVLLRLREVNDNNLHPRDREIEELASDIERLTAARRLDR